MYSYFPLLDSGDMVSEELTLKIVALALSILLVILAHMKVHPRLAQLGHLVINLRQYDTFVRNLSEGHSWRRAYNTFRIANWIVTGFLAGSVPQEFLATLSFMCMAIQAIPTTILELSAPNTLRAVKVKEVVDTGRLSIDAVETAMLVPGVYLMFKSNLEHRLRASLTVGSLIFAYLLGPIQADQINRLFEVQRIVPMVGGRNSSRIAGQQRIFWVGVITQLCSIFRLACIVWWMVDVPWMFFDILSEHLQVDRRVSVGLAVALWLPFVIELLPLAIVRELCLDYRVLRSPVHMLELIGAHNIPIVDAARATAVWLKGGVHRTPNLAGRQLHLDVGVAVEGMRYVQDAIMSEDVKNVATQVVTGWRVDLYLDTEEQGVAAFMRQLASLYGYASFWKEIYCSRQVTLFQATSNIVRLLAVAAGLDDTQGQDLELIDSVAVRARLGWVFAGGREVSEADQLEPDSERARQLQEFTAYTFRLPGKL